jgi:hypothetical protein
MDRIRLGVSRFAQTGLRDSEAGTDDLPAGEKI